MNFSACRPLVASSTLDRARITFMDTLDTAYTSPLAMADKLISLAKVVDLAGCAELAEQLLVAASKLLDGHIAKCAGSVGQDIQEAQRLRAECRLN